MINPHEFRLYSISFQVRKKRLNLWAVRATMPTPHNEDKLIGGQMMNYEANPFRDYESITIDGLKEQTSNLLDLVTEEQRPLRVCMNNGKEFLLFPQDLPAPICDSDFRLILLSAMRYAMGRNTCMPAVFSDYIKRHIRFILSATFGFWTISFLRWLPMISAGTLKTTQSMNRI